MFLGIDVGTGGTRAILIDRDGKVIYGHPVELLEAEEGGAFGAALLAGTGIGAWPSVEAACATTIRFVQTIPPQHAEVMNEAYSRYRKAYPALQ